MVNRKSCWVRVCLVDVVHKTGAERFVCVLHFLYIISHKLLPTMTMKLHVLLTLFPVAAMAQTVCISSNNVFHVKVNLFASELGT